MDTASRPLPPEWWPVRSRSLPDLPSHTIVRLAFRDQPPIEVLTPRAIVTPEWLEYVAGLVLKPPPPPAPPS